MITIGKAKWRGRQAELAKSAAAEYTRNNLPVETLSRIENAIEERSTARVKGELTKPLGLY